MTVHREKKSDHETIYFIYDGECPICKMGADLYQLKQNVGKLQTLDARLEQNHPIMKEINQAKLDLDQGMVIKYQDKLYHGKDAMHLMAKLGADKGLFNIINNRANKYAGVARMTYPPLKAIRNLLIRILGVSKLNNLGNHDR